MKGDDIWAVNEERLNREKYYRGFPELSIEKILKISHTPPSELDKIAVAGGYRGKKRLLRLKKGLKDLIPDERDKIVTVDHHLAHASSAYFTGADPETTILTIDAAGDGLSSTVYEGRDGRLLKRYESSYLDSLGDFYASITQMIGLSPMRDEGKTMGIAAYADEDGFKGEELSSWITVDGVGFENHLEVTGSRSAEIMSERLDYPYQKRRKIRRKLEKEELGDEYVQRGIQLAGRGQRHLEGLLATLCRNLKEDGRLNEKKKIGYAGGVAQNVKGNAVLRDHFTNCWVYPHMGDGGLALGAALHANSYLSDRKVIWDWREDVENVYMGPEYDEERIEESLKGEDLVRLDVDDVPSFISERLMDGDTVSVFRGKMEYGPRALGNRSILADPSAERVKERLNDMLGRMSLQPFAPLILKGRVDDYLVDRTENRFMTMSSEVTDRARKEIPAVVHVDGTTRPQVISKDDNVFIYRIMKGFEGRAGIGALLNTSFNLHGEPIVCSPEDAVRTFKKAGLDLMVMEDQVLTADGDL